MGIINKLTLKQLLANKKRTLVTIIGIIISVAMFTAVTTFTTSFMKMMQLEVASYSGNWHVAYDNLNQQQATQLTNSKKYQDTLLVQNIDTLLIDETNPNFAILHQLTNYSNLKLTAGKYPQNSNEIMIPQNYYLSNFDVGSEITVKANAAALAANYLKSQELQTMDNLTPQTYKIVGIYQTNYLNYEENFDVLYTANNNHISTNKVYLTLNHVDKSIFENAENTASELGISSQDTIYHFNLLYYFGVSNNNAFNQSMYTVVGIVIAIIMIGSIGLIYNAFAISLNERSRYLGTLSSIGATKRQKKQSVYFEGVAVGLIAIILGIIAGIGGMAVTFKIINPILAQLGQKIGFPLTISFSGILVAILCAIVTIFISSILPARQASKISPIAAINNHQDQKIKVSSIKTSFITRKLFGFEGDLAMKNIKRNKNRYRITLISLIISSVLFLTASGFTYYLKESYNMTTSDINYDGFININSENQALLNDLSNLKNIDELAIAKETYLNLDVNIDDINPELVSFLKDNEQSINDSYYLDFNIITYNHDYLQKHPKLNDQLKSHILINKTNNIKLNRKYKQTSILKDNITTISGKSFNQDNQPVDITLNNLAYSDQYYLGQTAYETPFSLNVIINNNMLSQLTEQYQLAHNNTNIYYTSSNNEAVLKEITEIFDKYPDEVSYSYNQSEEINQANQLILIINIFTYGFIVLIGLISIANIINTISTSMALRSREFSMLKSIGMTPKAFNKMIYFESLFYGIKTLIYSLPLGLGIMYLLYQRLTNVFDRSFTIPIDSFIILIIAVLVIVFTTLTFSSQKIKKLTIIDGLKNENI